MKREYESEDKEWSEPDNRLAEKKRSNKKASTT
jgi:hypothetical protein